MNQNFEERFLKTQQTNTSTEQQQKQLQQYFEQISHYRKNYLTIDDLSQEFSMNGVCLKRNQLISIFSFHEEFVNTSKITKNNFINMVEIEKTDQFQKIFKKIIQNLQTRETKKLTQSQKIAYRVYPNDFTSFIRYISYIQNRKLIEKDLLPSDQNQKHKISENHGVQAQIKMFDTLQTINEDFSKSSLKQLQQFLGQSEDQMNKQMQKVAQELDKQIKQNLKNEILFKEENQEISFIKPVQQQQKQIQENKSKSIGPLEKIDHYEPNQSLFSKNQSKQILNQLLTRNQILPDRYGFTDYINFNKTQQSFSKLQLDTQQDNLLKSLNNSQSNTFLKIEEPNNKCYVEILPSLGKEIPRDLKQFHHKINYELINEGKEDMILKKQKMDSNTRVLEIKKLKEKIKENNEFIRQNFKTRMESQTLLFTEKQNVSLLASNGINEEKPQDFKNFYLSLENQSPQTSQINQQIHPFQSTSSFYSPHVFHYKSSKTKHLSENFQTTHLSHLSAIEYKNSTHINSNTSHNDILFPLTSQNNQINASKYYIPNQLVSVLQTQ